MEAGLYQAGRITVECPYPILEVYMSAIIVLRDQEFEIRSGMTIRSALLKLEIQPEGVIATREGDLLTDDELIEVGDTIKLVAVISGG